MSHFIRPEARAALMRWRETIAGTTLAILGIWWIIGPGNLMTIIGAAAVLAGLALTFVGIQRARFRSAQDGIGTVEVDEGQVTYFGPLTGGALALRDMTELALLRTAVTSHWRLTARDTQLYIPIDAAGTDALFDAFATLPGLKMEHLLATRNDASAQDTVIWTKTSARPSAAALH
ncbi:MAG: hypothetical protein AAF754_02935 [Pseudomonadota bacterium]